VLIYDLQFTIDALQQFFQARAIVKLPIENVSPLVLVIARGQYSVWTELLNMTPSGTAYTGLTAAGQSFVDPAGGPTIKLESISATGATVTVTYPDGGKGSPTCMDGTPMTAPGPSSCAGSPTTTGTGGTGAGGGMTGTGGAGGAHTTGAGGTGIAMGAAGKTGASATGGANGSGGTISTGGTTGLTGSGGTPPSGGTGSGGTVSPGDLRTGGSSGTAPGETLMGGCSCSTDPTDPASRTAVWLSLAVGLVLSRARRRSQRRPA